MSEKNVSRKPPKLRNPRDVLDEAIKVLRTLPQKFSEAHGRTTATRLSQAVYAAQMDMQRIECGASVRDEPDPLWIRHGIVVEQQELLPLLVWYNSLSGYDIGDIGIFTQIDGSHIVHFPDSNMRAKAIIFLTTLGTLSETT